MKEKFKTILYYSVIILLLMFFITYIFRTLIDYGCSSSALFFVSKESKTNTEYLGSRSFLGVNCMLWERLIQVNDYK